MSERDKSITYISSKIKCTIHLLAIICVWHHADIVIMSSDKVIWGIVGWRVYLLHFRLTTPIQICHTFKYLFNSNFHLCLGSFIKFLSFNDLFLFPEWTLNWQSTCRESDEQRCYWILNTKQQKTVFLFYFRLKNIDVSLRQTPIIGTLFML